MNSTASLLRGSAGVKLLKLAGLSLILGLRPAEALVEGAKVTFTAFSEGSPAVSFVWKKNGVTLPGATNATLVLPKVTLADAGTYRVIASNVAGSAESADEVLVVEAAAVPVAPVAVVAAPAPVTTTNAANIPVVRGVAAGETATPTTVKENREVVVAASVSGKRSEGEAGSVVAADAVATPDAPASSRIVNLSVRSRVAPESEALVVGFVLGGNATKPLLLRGVGPGLADFGVVDAMIDPSLALYSGTGLKGSNDNWMAGEDAAAVRGAVERLGAFPLAEASTDAALMANLGSGAYTVELRNKSDEAGVALLELYDAGSNSGANLVNLSVLARVEAGSEAPSLGFVVSGNAPKRVLIRAVGPTLASFGVEGALADPKLEIFKGADLVGANDNWEGNPALRAAFASVGAFAMDDAASGDAALVVTLSPGAYTVVASAVGDAAGTALVEIYDLP
jgi:hypothetical protein